MGYVTDKERQGQGNLGADLQKSMLGGVPGVFTWLELGRD
jgi:hypothetical protein